VWEIKAGTNSLITLASFDGPNGNHPFGGVTIDAKGDLFGTTVQGGAYGSYYGGDGTVWEIKAGTNMISTLASFSVTDTEAYGGVTIDAKGDLFGTTYGGGVNGEGTVWEIAAGGNTLTTLTSVNGVGDTSEGTSRYGPGVAIDANGNLIGATWAGGKYGDGSVWEIQGAAAVPEPSSIVLFGAGALGLALAEARRRAKSRVS
jgi:uncharacterized repeat protein (TIGR03803 family)